jgi:hypothetical protein
MLTPTEGEAAMADYFYYYTGAVYTKYNGVFVPPPSKRLFGILRLSGRLPPNVQNYFITDWVGYSFSDGVHRYSSSDSTATPYFQVSTDSSGNITSWDFYLGYWNEDTRAGSTYPGSAGFFDFAEGPILQIDWAFSTSPGGWQYSSEKPVVARRPFELRV